MIKSNLQTKKGLPERNYTLFSRTYNPILFSLSILAWFSTAHKVSKYGVFSGAYFPVFGLNTGKYGPE